MNALTHGGCSAQSQPGCVPSATTSDAEPSAAWEDHAKAAMAAIEPAIQPRLRKAADDVYADLLYTVQDYLLDNVLHNVRSQIAAADRQANIDRKRAWDAEADAVHLAAALRMCIARIEKPHLSPDANVVLERAKAIHHAHAKDGTSRERDPLREEQQNPPTGEA